MRADGRRLQRDWQGHLGSLGAHRAPGVPLHHGQPECKAGRRGRKRARRSQRGVARHSSEPFEVLSVPTRRKARAHEPFALPATRRGSVLLLACASPRCGPHTSARPAHLSPRFAPPIHTMSPFSPPSRSRAHASPVVSGDRCTHTGVCWVRRPPGPSLHPHRLTPISNLVGLSWFAESPTPRGTPHRASVCP